MDACCPEEILAYSKALRGRRDKMYFGYSWHARRAASRIGDRRMLKQGLDEGMKEAGLEHVDLWRMTYFEQHGPPDAEIDEAAHALAWAKQTGRPRFVGISSHERVHIKRLIKNYPEQMEIILTPYTAKTKWSRMKPDFGRP